MGNPSPAVTRAMMHSRLRLPRYPLNTTKILTPGWAYSTMGLDQNGYLAERANCFQPGRATSEFLSCSEIDTRHGHETLLSLKLGYISPLFVQLCILVRSIKWCDVMEADFRVEISFLFVTVTTLALSNTSEIAPDLDFFPCQQAVHSLTFGFYMYLSWGGWKPTSISTCNESSVSGVAVAVWGVI